jgi:5-methylcytosine-specific restriction endonuclease McrA
MMLWEVEMKIPNRLVLKLNADWRPHQIAPWQETIPLLLEGVVRIASPTGLEEDEEVYRWGDGSPILIRSGPGEDGVTPRITVRLPAVVILRDYVSVSKRRMLSPSRHAILQRDGYTCCFCGSDDGMMTIDHVLPRSKGGLTSFQNCCCACARCQADKGSRTLEEMRHRRTWNGLPFRLQHTPSEVRYGGIARYVYRVTRANLCWLNYLEGWEKIAPRIGKGFLIEEFERFEGRG